MHLQSTQLFKLNNHYMSEYRLLLKFKLKMVVKKYCKLITIDF